MKKISSTLILLLTTIASTSGFADNTNLVDQTKKNVKDLLKDPESAQFRNIKVVINTEGRKSVCGQVNAKNSYGGYTGFQSFYAKSNDKIVYLNDDVNYQLAGCEGKTNELKAKELQKEKLLKEKEEFRATVAPVWVVLNFFLMVTQFRSGLVGTADIRLICISILPLLIATWLGKKLVCKVSQKVFLNLTYILLLISGVSLIV